MIQDSRTFLRNAESQIRKRTIFLKFVKVRKYLSYEGITKVSWVELSKFKRKRRNVLYIYIENDETLTLEISKQQKQTSLLKLKLIGN